MIKWLVIIIILFICFIFIPIFLKLFNIKEGNINQINNTVRDIKNNVNSIKSSQIVDRQFLNGKIVTQAFSNFFNSYAKAFNKENGRTGSLFEKHFKRIKMNDEANEKEIIAAIDGKIQSSSARTASAPAPSNNTQMSEYNAKLGEYNAKLGEYNTGLNDPTKGMIPKIDIMNGFISAYNTNLTQNNTKIGELNAGLNHPTNGMIPKIDSMNAKIILR